MSPRTRLLIVLLIALAAFLLHPIVFDSLLRQMLYPAPAFRVPSPPPPPYEEVTLAEDVSAWAWTPAQPSRGGLLLLVFHGNGENLATLAMSGLLDELRELGVAFLAVDYPGYGRSGGRPSESANMAAAQAALAWARQHHPERRPVAWGWSLGAAVALELAARNPRDIAGLVALSPWSRLEDIARQHFPGWLVGLTVRERYDSLAAASAYPGPALVLHGAEDVLIPPDHGQAVASRLAGLHRWRSLPGAGHNDLLGHPEVWVEIRAFLDRLPPAGP